MQVNDWVDDLFQRLGNPPRGHEKDMLAYLFLSIEEFCVRGGMWQDIIKEDVISGQDTYTITTPQHSRVQCINSIKYDNGHYETPLSPLLQGRVNMTSIQQSSGAPSWYWINNDLSVTVFPTPDTDQVEGLIFGVCLAPTAADALIPDDIATRWKEPIIDGALSKLYLIPHKPWVNPQLSMVHAMNFEKAVNDCKVEVFMGPGYTGEQTASNMYNAYFSG